MASDKCGCLPIPIPAVNNCTLPAVRNLSGVGVCGLLDVGGGVQNTAFPLGCPAFFALGKTNSPILYPVLDGSDILAATVWESAVQTVAASGSSPSFTFFYRLTIDGTDPWLLERVTVSHPDPSYPAVIEYRNVHYHTGASLGPSVVHLDQSTDKFNINKWFNRGINCGTQVDGNGMAHAPFTRYHYADVRVTSGATSSDTKASVDKTWYLGSWVTLPTLPGLWASTYINTAPSLFPITEGGFYSVGPNHLNTKSLGIFFSINCTTGKVEACAATVSGGVYDRRAKVTLGEQDWFDHLPVTLPIGPTTSVTILAMGNS